MGLVDNDCVVLLKVPVAVDLVQQDAVGHELDARQRASLVREPHLISDNSTQVAAELLRDALGDRSRGDPTGLRVGDRVVAELHQHLG